MRIEQIRQINEAAKYMNESQKNELINSIAFTNEVEEVMVHFSNLVVQGGVYDWSHENDIAGAASHLIDLLRTHVKHIYKAAK